MRALIEAGADINKATDNGVTPLYIGAGMGHETVVQALLGAGANVNKTDIGGTPTTPVYIAAVMGHEAIVQILRDAGAVGKSESESECDAYV